MTSRRTSLLVGWCTSCAVLILDQATKVAVASRLPVYESIPVLGQAIRITHTRNPGVAFGLSLGVLDGWALTVLTACGVIAIGAYLFGQSARGAGRASMVGLILGGAAGNLIDRIRLGEVVDFLDVGIGPYRWPVFNVADSVVVVGVALLLLTDRERHARSDVPPPD